MSESEPESYRSPKRTIELTLTIEGHYDPQQLVEDWTPDHAYGPVERVTIERDMWSSHRCYDIVGAEAEVTDTDN